MKNTGLGKFMNADENTFTSDLGLEMRNATNPLFRKVLKLATKRNLIIEQKAELNKDENYVFVTTHGFEEDIVSSLQAIDRNAYILSGSLDQTMHNPAYLAMWANGMIFVNRKDKESRTNAIAKGKRVLENNSILVFPEGSYNNTENELVQNLFHSPYIWSKECNVKVVPMATYNEIGTDDVFVRMGDPIDLSIYNKYEASNILRDQMATLYYNMLEEHNKYIKREDLTEWMLAAIEHEYKRLKLNKSVDELDKQDMRALYMEMRRTMYLPQKWYDVDWNEEITYYPGHNNVRPDIVNASFDSVKLTKNNYHLVADFQKKSEENKK